MSEKLCLQWNDFQENIKSAFGNLREDKDFTDVTLACGDGQQVEAHKVVLAASSPFFQKLLGRNKHPHPIIYMTEMKAENLLAIVDFLYRGEANILQKNLDSFLAIADELQLMGLMGKTEDKYFEDEKPLLSFDISAKVPKTSPRKRVSSTEIHNPEENRTLAILNSFSGDLDELEERVTSMMEKSRNNLGNGKGFAKRCKVCGKEGQAPNIKDHIEANHLEGIVVPCGLCNKTFRSRNALRCHNRKEVLSKIHNKNG